MNEIQLVVVLAGFLTLWPASLTLRWLDLKTATWWIIAPLTLFYVALAAGWFFLFQWLEMPVIAYIDVIVYGLMACWAILVAVGRWLTLSDQQRVPGGAVERGQGESLQT